EIPCGPCGRNEAERSVLPVQFVANAVVENEVLPGVPGVLPETRTEWSRIVVGGGCQNPVDRTVTDERPPIEPPDLVPRVTRGRCRKTRTKQVSRQTPKDELLRLVN